MKSTSSRSVRGTPKMALAPGDSGTPPIAESSAFSFTGYTEWTVTLMGGERYVVTLPGDRGRVSYGQSPHRSGAEVRFYRDESTKVFEAVIPGVMTIVSNRVTVSKAPPTAEDEAREKAREEIAREYTKVALDRVAEAIVRRDYSEPEEVPF